MTAFDRLVERAGIEAEFKDANGETRRTHPSVARGLLEAMGLDADDERRSRETLEHAETEEASQVLPRVIVTTAPGTPLTVPLNIPAATDVLAWEIHEEGGTRHQGRATLESTGRTEHPLTIGLETETSCWTRRNPSAVTGSVSKAKASRRLKRY